MFTGVRDAAKLLLIAARIDIFPLDWVELALSACTDAQHAANQSVDIVFWRATPLNSMKHTLISNPLQRKQKSTVLDGFALCALRACVGLVRPVVFMC